MNEQQYGEGVAIPRSFASAWQSILHRRVTPAVVPELSIELLIICLSYIPRQPRLRCVSLVCKRWRAAALYSIASLSYSPPAAHIFSLDSFPLLKKLNLSGCWSGDVPPTVEHLIISGDAMPNPCPVAHLSMNGSLISADRAGIAQAFLRSSITTLTALDISVVLLHDTRFAGFFCAVQLPLLQSLSVSFPLASVQPTVFASQSLLGFFTTHAAQLRSLTLSGENNRFISPTLATLSFPVLVHLSVQLDLAPFLLTSLLLNCPALQDFRLAQTAPLADVPIDGLHALTDLRIPSQRWSQPQQAFLDALLRLRSVRMQLTLRDLAINASVTFLSRLSMIIALEADAQDIIWTVLPLTPNVEDLVLASVVPTPAPICRYPRLRRLYLDFTRHTFAAAVVTLQYFFAASPSLCHVEVALPPETDNETADLAAALREQAVRCPALSVYLKVERVSPFLDWISAYANQTGWLSVSLTE